MNAFLTFQTCFLFLSKHFLTKFYDRYKDLRSEEFDKESMEAN